MCPWNSEGAEIINYIIFSEIKKTLMIGGPGPLLKGEKNEKNLSA